MPFLRWLAAEQNEARAGKTPVQDLQAADDQRLRADADRGNPRQGVYENFHGADLRFWAGCRAGLRARK